MPEGPSIVIAKEALLPFVGKKVMTATGNAKIDMSLVEVLFRIRVHPKSVIGKLPPKQKSALIREARKYSFDFLKWKRNFALRKHWLIYTKKTCPRDHSPVKKEYLGTGRRRTFFCDKCQVLYD